MSMSQFQVTIFGQLCYFLRIEVSWFPQEILLAQRKYVVDTLIECRLLGCKQVDNLMLVIGKLLLVLGSPMKNLEIQRDLL